MPANESINGDNLFKKIKDIIASFLKANNRLVFCCLFLIAFLGFEFFTVQSAQSAQSPPCTASSTLNTPAVNSCEPVACQSLGSDAKNPDNPTGYNCYYAPLGEPLRPCKAFQNISAINNPNPRVNCADLIDLPLCSVFGTEDEAGINCVREGADVNGPGIRGVDYAIHNQDSIRFCGTSGGNLDCVNKKCHQLTRDETPKSVSGGNCSILPCNLVSIDELKVSDTRFDDYSKKYCDGSTVKCYDFFNDAPDNLKYIKYSSNSNSMCQIHNCRPVSPTCDPAKDIDNILNKPDLYKDAYKTNITLGNSINQFCKQLSCKPITQKQYRCKPVGGENPDTLNDSCDTCVKCNTENCPQNADCESGEELQICSGGYCNEEIDCNLSINDTKAECFPASTDGQNIDTPDLFNAWFYRPIPLNNCQPKIEQHECNIPPTGSEATDLNDFCDSCVSCETGESCPASQSCPQAGTKDQICNNGFCNKTTPCISFLDSNGYIHKNVSDIHKNVSDANRGDFCYDMTELRGIEGMLRIVAKDTVFESVWRFLYDGDVYGSMCGVNIPNTRFPGYGAISGNNANVYVNPPEDSSYIKGIATTNYLPSGDSIRKITGCLRYTDFGFVTAVTGTLSGRRNCRINISPGVSTQACGHDMCLEMEISNDDSNNCSLKNNNSPASTCVSASIDHDTRMRVRRYSDRRLCVFIDHAGAFAYNNKNYDGTEQLSDGSCVDGQKDEDSAVCNGKNTNDDYGLATIWRTVGMIKYIGNALGNGSNKRGYIDMDGGFYPEQECAKVPMRIGPPRFYNVATSANTRGLFEPPLYVINVRSKRGGQISISESGGGIGSTDFFQPEIEVGYGVTRQKMSLGNLLLGTEPTPENYPDSPSRITIASSSGEVSETPYSATIYVKKEYNANLRSPILTLYRQNKDQDGIPTNPIYISHVIRDKPEISNISLTNAEMKILISPDVDNTFSNAKLKLQLIADYVDDANNNCTGDDICSDEVSFENLNTSDESCEKIQESEFCSKRSECSALTYECAQNEIDINNAINNSGPLDIFESIRENCNNVLLPSCNRKLGIINTTASDFFEQTDLDKINSPGNTTPKSVLSQETLDQIDLEYLNAYGWFSEICIDKRGFKDGSDQVLAHKTINAVMGKCVVDPLKSLYLTDGDNDTNCDEGGKAPNCVCYVEGFALEETMEFREQTSREAGLCLDIPMPKICEPINYKYGYDDSDDDGGDDFVTSSISSSINGYENPIHMSHTNRTGDSDDDDDAEYDDNHAEYNSALSGSDVVYGECKGFWRYQTNTSGSELRPSLACNIDGSWKNIQSSNTCIRYSCPAIITSYSDSDDLYEGAYAIGEEGEDRGLRHGFATWSKYTKTDDSLEYAQAAYTKTDDSLEDAQVASCLVGFEPEKINDIEVLPTRYCDQLGRWQYGATNSCERITCREQSIDEGTLAANPTSFDEILAWTKNGGAEFKTDEDGDGNPDRSFNASRSETKILGESTFSGTCNYLLGFYKFDNTLFPSRVCQSDGTWGDIKNPCVTDCKEISGVDAKQPIHGYASWDLVTPTLEDEIINAEGSCVDSVANPYLLDVGGNVLFNPDDQGNITYSTNSISYNTDNGLVSGTAISPNRNCSKFSLNEEVSTASSPSAWQKVENPCIKSCPSISQYVKVSTGDVNNPSKDALIRWSKTPFGHDDYHISGGCSNGDTTDASAFDGTRTGCYYLKRKCNDDGRWGEVVPMCVANGGEIGNAKYTAGNNASATNPDYNDAIDAVEVYDSDRIQSSWNHSITSQICIDNYSNVDAWPIAQCSYNNNGHRNVDEVFYSIIDGTDCAKTCDQNYSGNASYSGSHSSTPVEGNSINLSCTGSQIKVGTPTATCTNGSWSLNVNNSKRCRNPIPCSGNPIGSATTWNRSPTSCSFQTFKLSDYGLPTTNIPHGYNSGPICRYSSVSHATSCGTISICHFTFSEIVAKCDDGIYSLVSERSGSTSCENDNSGILCTHFNLRGGWTNLPSGTHVNFSWTP
ncbi:MAG: hypothetical protein ACJAVG_000223 [Rickettsiales bacterium]